MSLVDANLPGLLSCSIRCWCIVDAAAPTWIASYGANCILLRKSPNHH